jgi:polyisoprenoid-binding protein YceI
MMRFAFAALTLTAVVAALPVIAQMPTTVPGAKDPSRVVAGTYTVDGAHTQVLWKVMHLGFNPYFGLLGEAKGSLTLDPAKPSAAKVWIEIPIGSILTSNAELTTHLKKPEFFDQAKFATATFKSTSIVVDGNDAKISGDLTIKGVTKPVVLDAEFTGAGNGPMNKKPTIGFEAETKIKRSDFGISYGIPFVPDEVPLEISVAFEKA